MAHDEPDSPESEGEQPPWLGLLAEIAEVRRGRLDWIEYHAIGLVRSSGATWEDIGEALGISRQAARQRFGKPSRRRRLPRA